MSGSYLQTIQPQISIAANNAGISTDLYNAILKQEGGTSATGTFLTSSTGAYGPAQIEPYTAKAYGVAPSSLSDLQTNLNLGAKIVADNIKQYSGNIAAALAQYNGGTSQGKLVAAGQSPSNSQTQNYVTSIMNSLPGISTSDSFGNGTPGTQTIGIPGLADNVIGGTTGTIPGTASPALGQRPRKPSRQHRCRAPRSLSPAPQRRSRTSAMAPNTTYGSRRSAPSA